MATTPQVRNTMAQRPRRPPVRVTTVNDAIDPSQVETVRQNLARNAVDNNPPAAETAAPPRFNPRDLSGLASMPSPQAKTDINIESIRAAFARAGQEQPKFVAAPPITRESSHPGIVTNEPPPIPPMRAPINASPAASPVTGELNETRVTEPISNNPLAFREILPSNNVFYQSPALELRPFELPEYAQLFIARSENNETMFIDTVNSVCSVDVRDLSLKDFRYLLYKLRFRSSLKSPYKLSYTSMYGNRCEFTVHQTNLQVNVLQATPEEYQEWQQRGLTMPTLRDYEEYNGIANRLGPSGDFYWSRAKYVQGDSVTEKINNLKELARGNMDFVFSDIEQFAAKFENYGVVESTEVADTQFNQDKALAFLNNNIAQIDAALSNQAVAASVADFLLTRRSDFQAEVNRIQQQIQTTGEAAPKRETITFSIEIADFFPVI